MQGFHIVFLVKNVLPNKYHLVLGMCQGLGDELGASRTALPWTVSSRALQTDSSRMVGGRLFLSNVSPDNSGGWSGGPLLTFPQLAKGGNLQKFLGWRNSSFQLPYFFTEKLALFPSPSLLSSLLVVFCRHFPQMTLLEPKWNKRSYPLSALSPLTTKCFQSVEKVFSSLFCSLCSLAAHSDSRICLIWGKPCMCCDWLLLLVICSLEPFAAQFK